MRAWADWDPVCELRAPPTALSPVMRLILLVLFASLRAASSYLAPPPAALTRTRLAVVSSGGAETALPVRARALPCARPTLLRACPRLDGGAAQDSIISFSERALTQIQELREKSGKERACLRMGVRAGGCSGMSCAPPPARVRRGASLRAPTAALSPCRYVMDFMEEGEIDEKDTTIDYEQVCRHRARGL